MLRASMTTVMLGALAATAWAQGPTMPERRLYVTDEAPAPTNLQCAVLRDGSLVTLANESYDNAVARFFDPVGDPRSAVVVVADRNVIAAHLSARGDGFV